MVTWYSLVIFICFCAVGNMAISYEGIFIAPKIYNLFGINDNFNTQIIKN